MVHTEAPCAHQSHCGAGEMMHGTPRVLHSPQRSSGRRRMRLQTKQMMECALGEIAFVTHCCRQTLTSARGHRAGCQRALHNASNRGRQAAGAQSGKRRAWHSHSSRRCIGCTQHFQQPTTCPRGRRLRFRGCGGEWLHSTPSCNRQPHLSTWPPSFRWRRRSSRPCSCVWDGAGQGNPGFG